MVIFRTVFLDFAVVFLVVDGTSVVPACWGVCVLGHLLYDASDQICLRLQWIAQPVCNEMPEEGLVKCPLQIILCNYHPSENDELCYFGRVYSISFWDTQLLR